MPAAGTFTGSQSGAAALSVQPDAATVVITPSANPSPPNKALTLKATVTAAAPGSGTPTGTVTFYNGKKSLGTATLSGGVATLTTKKLTLGNHTIKVIYHGDADFTGNTSPGLRESIKKAAKSKKPKARTLLSGGADERPGGRTALAWTDGVPSTLLRDLALESLDDQPIQDGFRLER